MLFHRTLAILILVLPIMAHAQGSSSSVTDLPDAPVPQISTIQNLTTPTNVALEPPSKFSRIEYTTYRSSQIFVLAGLGADINYAIAARNLNSYNLAGFIAADVGIDGLVLYASHRFQKRGGKIGKSLAIALNAARGTSHFYMVHQNRMLMQRASR